MAEDADGDYYYDAGTVNEQFDNIALVEGDDELAVETPDGVSRLGGLESVLGAFRESQIGAGDLASGESALYFLDNGDSTYTLEAAFHNPDDDAVQYLQLGTVGSAPA
jgi:hypothetical protein